MKRSRWRSLLCAFVGHDWTMWSMFGGNRMQFRWCRRCDEPQVHDTWEAERRALLMTLLEQDERKGVQR